jgi:hypothetical protein
MYKWLIFLHVLGVFGFLMAHGVSMSVAFALRRERNFERVQTLLNLSASSIEVMLGSLAVLLISGVITGFMGHWWGKGWIWLSFGLLIAISVYMGISVERYYGQVRKLTGLEYRDGSKFIKPDGPASDEEINDLLDHPKLFSLSVIGFGGLAVITWLMLFKPF